MYTLPSKLKLFSIIIMVLGLAGITYGFLTAPKTIDDVKEIMAEQDAHHSDEHALEAHGEEHTANFVDVARGEEGYSEAALEHATDLKPEGHGSASHEEHVLHQLQTRPWSATFVGAFFFLMIVSVI